MEALTSGSKKVKAFVVMALAIIVCLAVTTVLHTPDPVTTNGLWIIGFGGLFAIGGQSLVDSLEKFADMRTKKEDKSNG